MKISVILSTYNSFEWLVKVLWGFRVQTITDFDIVIADDGSNDETKEKIVAFKKI
jgi:glycosyltransferase involved in cell wall biosynthesis